MRLRDDHFLATVFEKADCALDLRPHAAGGEMSFVEVLLTLCNIQVIQIDLFGRSKVQRDLVDVGRDNKDRRAEFAGEQTTPAGARAYEGAPPTIPHRTLMRENCMSCHGEGGTSAIRTSHPDRQSCTQCHATDASYDQREFLKTTFP